MVATRGWWRGVEGRGATRGARMLQIEGLDGVERHGTAHGATRGARMLQIEGLDGVERHGTAHGAARRGAHWEESLIFGIFRIWLCGRRAASAERAACPEAYKV